MSDDQVHSGERTMNYGKEKISVYRNYATPLEGVQTIPESDLDGRENIFFGLDVRVQVEDCTGRHRSDTDARRGS